MTKCEDLQFLVLMIPTFVVLAAAIISLVHPDVDAVAQPAPYAVTPDVPDPKVVADAEQ
jgi:hypothetical protein